MKRRDFLKISSAAVPAATISTKAFAQNSSLYEYPHPKTLQDVITQEGEVLVRLKFVGTDATRQFTSEGSSHVDFADLIEIKPFSFEAVDDVFDPTDASYRLRANQKNADFFVLRLKDVNSESRIRIVQNGNEFNFKLVEILKNGYLLFEHSESKIEVNFLLDHEIGEINLAQIGVNENPDEFSFHIFADPQGGDPLHPQSHRTRMRIHNAFIEDSIILANSQPQRPLFTLILGDIVDSQGQPENFTVMNRYWQGLKSPVLYELGNHESKYSATFEPGYDMSELHNFFDAQKQVNGLDKILYSFNAGEWHFVVWPDPLRSFFWDNHPHYFDWLERDLEKYKDRPTFVFQHVPVHPIGISPFQSYLDYTAIRKTFVDIVTKHGNVKYVLSGHIHIPVKSSLKTACSIRGTNFITLPAAGYRPRGFGEEDFLGGPTQGIAIVDIKGNRAEVRFKTVMEEEITYPQKCAEFDENLHRLWFNNKWDVDAPTRIRNGSFKNGLDTWIPEYVYPEDENPSNICEVRRIDGRDAIYLFNKIRGYQAPGQDRLPQTINRISTVVQLQNANAPVLHFKYKLDKENCDLNGRCGGYLWIEGYEKSFRQFNLVYSAGVAYANPIAKWTEKNHDVFHFDLPAHFDWADVRINIKDDFNAIEQERVFDELTIDRLVFTLGVWTLNEGTSQPFGIYFTDFELVNQQIKSQINGQPVQHKTDDKIWWQGRHIPFIHLAGEHRYHLQTAPETRFVKEHSRFKKYGFD
jgi:hypothetical protein